MKLIYFSLVLSLSAYANMDPKVGFIPFPNHYFVETGTFNGEGIKFALSADFKEIYSIEIEREFVENAKRRFAQDHKVHIIHGDSRTILLDLIKDFDKPITFWLDGHIGFARTDGGKHTPLMEELEQLKYHPIKNHTIIIDDMHCCGGILFDYLTREDIIEKIKEINPEYVISYIAGGDDGEYPNNIMIAQVK